MAITISLVDLHRRSPSASCMTNPSSTHYENGNAPTHNALWRTFLNISSSSEMASTTTAITSTTTSKAHIGAGLIDIGV